MTRLVSAALVAFSLVAGSAAAQAQSYTAPAASQLRLPPGTAPTAFEITGFAGSSDIGALRAPRPPLPWAAMTSRSSRI